MADKGKFTLKYFNGAGRAEPIRWMLAYSKANFEDQRIEQPQWPQQKPSMPLKQLPVMEWTSADGKTKAVHCQSGALIRIVASTFGLNGKTPCQMARAEEALESLRELQDIFFAPMFEKDETRKKALMEAIGNDHVPRILGYMETKAKENGNKNLAGGEGFTHADFFLGALFDMIKKNMPQIDVGKPFPGLAAIAKAVADTEGVKAYLAKRPA